MNKYQEKLLAKGAVSFESEKNKEKLDFNYGENLIKLYQNEDYRLGGYKLFIENSYIDYINYDNKVKKSNMGIFSFDINFQERISCLNIYFKGNLAEPCRIILEYVLSNKDEFDNKLKERRKAEFEKALNFVCRKDDRLINIHWMNASDDVIATKIRMYALIGPKKMFMQEKTFDRDTCFMAIDKLVEGDYIFEAIQTDKLGNIIINVSKEVNIIKTSNTVIIDSRRHIVRP